MEFSTLQNQEEACKAYILSQAFNNWEYYKTYSDGGISGGTMERPGLQNLLNDIRVGQVQVVVVYKVDRLSRSIIDFHKMMREFSKYEYNFVSITQSFDMSNSMGKLTPNMLLSFARFEREVSSERVRDKIAVLASKLYDDKGQNFRFTSSKKQDKEFLYYYNGMGGTLFTRGAVGQICTKYAQNGGF